MCILHHLEGFNHILCSLRWFFQGPSSWLGHNCQKDGKEKTGVFQEKIPLNDRRTGVQWKRWPRYIPTVYLLWDGAPYSSRFVQMQTSPLVQATNFSENLLTELRRCGNKDNCLVRKLTYAVWAGQMRKNLLHICSLVNKGGGSGRNSGSGLVESSKHCPELLPNSWPKFSQVFADKNCPCKRRTRVLILIFHLLKGDKDPARKDIMSAKRSY
jgi:hypothetical protein